MRCTQGWGDRSPLLRGLAFMPGALLGFGGPQREHSGDGTCDLDWLRLHSCIEFFWGLPDPRCDSSPWIEPLYYCLCDPIGIICLNIRQINKGKLRIFHQRCNFLHYQLFMTMASLRHSRHWCPLVAMFICLRARLRASARCALSRPRWAS